MDNDGIDASIGLAFSLDIFRRYKRSGILQAELRRIPGMLGPSVASLHLVQGAVASCYLEDKNGLRSSVSKDVLIRFDNEKGPFEWRFLFPSSGEQAELAPATQLHSHMVVSSSSPLPNAAVLYRIVSSIPGDRLLSCTLPQRRIFIMVWQAIDGKKTVQGIKATLAASFSHTVVDEILHILIEWNIVIIR